ncbi:exodeoxyribonuclease VII large subunit [Campylobacter jejuni]|uniref:Exodeoxyribonuclease 7 large subunit n=1 Tax=Campylobacter jejuni TaxID=197 RepID=A0A2R4D310_CAMJU|nr:MULTISPECIES: exodeoxyribonuclease VII large subunit [Campylobacter]AHW91369.1 exodeoxyribonuclease VII large subunit [Campylobacter jejuni subsp. jejuni R14]APA46721.1 exodeoxyribonuclease VII large subunit [Campylobacter jejuni]AVS36784.1 exodeoxyribonuclease VII large subunit [Campylobacter jejuni]AYA31805.1 exodeoxyribonuclease VII large subunit [Campylobacter jejuni subsp. jejuni]AZN10358.1 exodeoxyribonuclease VII large subunit [Campylobacter jejuni subsp. jejuni]
MTPTELNLKAKALLETHFDDIVLSGEISKITLHGSGHWYFDLKDERSSIACAMFKGANLKVGFKPAVGDFLELCGSVSLYPESGRYQFIATSMKKAGFGDLEAQFLALKERLQKEGLFDSRFKKSLPKFPKKVGIITSKTSAALQDMLKLIHQKEYFLAKIYIFDALTQGNSAPFSLIQALKKADDMDLDVLIIARGGGSREDLFWFNDENLAREIFKAKTPIISAIGHEIDYVISDFVADFRAPTPSAAIDALFYSKLDIEQSLDLMEEKLMQLWNYKIQNYENLLLNLSKFFKFNSLPKIIDEKIKQSYNIEKQLNHLLANQMSYNELKLDKLQNAYLQHENFFNKSKKFICIRKNGKIVNLEDLKSDDIVILSSLTSQKEAKIL